ncbi:MAG TPA: ornithine carbamoyltransferase [Chloroflexus aurantiacus]|jgi:ornithine carbamoyltransferase|uniref:Ornithine carbamoyltransferase n=1 Tax=Chloroflexus aurantiacus (strain ATCC 29366 / DSM 635 / J-10-fl) TaxID=324602 RepID=A9WB17_CHLAA|nr:MULTISPECIES: ornithine carbamoyltransferase [Chloroflexus]ABY34798.1 ornithine carbamoyltransferase [Chloroflexus aurantiacus J-10-fl]RMG51942.1 MAG: ornithine carbamoyltransferase [Chloroflexota bacterium]GIV95018.1 MAG: ornithine carbamoyltransferase, catabolic [Chloroflexus sp.]HBW69416.1 ornithine carbamoyltransferase [Chloroflexus aurantiacus]
MTLRHFLSAADLNRAEAEALLDRAAMLKAAWRAGQVNDRPLLGQTLALVFEKPSLRTRVAFEAGMTQLGGHPSYLSANDIDMGGRESVPDVARNLSRWVAIIAARVFKHATVETLARYATVPVINALSDREHPCQALADMLTLRERFGRLQGLTLAYVGDGNNVCHSLMLLGATLGLNLRIGCPPDYRPAPDIIELTERLAQEHDATLAITASPVEAVSGADAVYTDVWASMGQEHEAARRRPVFTPYQVNTALMAHAAPHALAMHCLPAHRGEEVTAEVIDGPQSVVFEQAENRLHVQKALILFLLGK